MTKHKIDDLFSKKLAGSEFTPSPAAWSKLEDQLVHSKKKGIIFWMSLAASVLILFTFGWVMFGSDNQISSNLNIAQQNEDHPVIISSVDSADVDEILNLPIISDNPEQAPRKESTEKVNSTTDPKSASKEIKKNKPPKKKPQLFMIQQQSNLAINDPLIELPTELKDSTSRDSILNIDITELVIEDNIAVNNEDQSTTPISKESGAIKLVYTLKPAVTAQSIAKTTVEEEKKSSFGKAMAFAKNIKNNPKGIGNLRNAKNSFLSLSKKNNSK
jgi:hypothetical protein